MPTALLHLSSVHLDGSWSSARDPTQSAVMQVGNNEPGTAALENVGRRRQGELIRGSATNYLQSDPTPARRRGPVP